MRVIEASIPLEVESATSGGARNDYATLPSIVGLAEIAAEHPMVLQAIGPHIAKVCNDHGYSENTLGALRSKVMTLMPCVPDAAKATINALNMVSADYVLETRSSRFGKPANEIPGLFTSGITEAIVHRLLTRSGREDSDITEDAIFYKAGEKMSAKNLDFLWARSMDKQGALYECKNQPARLIDDLKHKGTPGHDADWRNSELWLMLEVRGLLVNCSWVLNLHVVTLRPEGAVEAKIGCIPFITVPPELGVVCLENLSRI